MRKEYDVIVVGGGAAGFFGALSAGHHKKGIRLCIIEKSTKILSKVKVSGGGRCNVTHACFNNSDLAKSYPRGGKDLKNAFLQFSTKDTFQWFEERGVKLKTEDDGRVFPITNDSQTIIDCLMRESKKLGVEILLGIGVQSIEVSASSFNLILSDHSQLSCSKLLIATGGNQKKESYQWLELLGHSIESPVPSLFTFNVPDSDIKALQGISVAQASVKVLGTKLEESGPLLITHWGFSGPAILKLSAWGAKILNGLDYKFKIYINWTGTYKDEGLRVDLEAIAENNKKKLIEGNPLFNISKRLWQVIVEKAGIEEDRRWLDISKKQMNKLIELLLRSEYQISGKTTFKEEFVTCGGIRLNEVDFQTMQSRKVDGLFFAGEVLDIDGITGGFNFQNAWTTGWVAGKNMAKYFS